MSDPAAPPSPKRLSNRRRATVAGLLALVAVIAIGLGTYRHFEPWILVRRVHPDMAPFSSLFDRPPSHFRCEACHGRTSIQGEMTALLASTPHTRERMLDCKSCHVQ